MLRRVLVGVAVVAAAGVFGWLVMSALGRVLRTPAAPTPDPATEAPAVAPPPGAEPRGLHGRGHDSAVAGLRVGFRRCRRHEDASANGTDC